MLLKKIAFSLEFVSLRKKIYNPYILLIVQLSFFGALIIQQSDAQKVAHGDSNVDRAPSIPLLYFDGSCH